MRRWLIPLTIALALAGLAGTAPFWWPAAVELIGAGGEAIQGLAAAVQIVIWVIAGAIALVAYLWRNPPAAPPAAAGDVRPADPGAVRARYLADLVTRNQFLPMKGLGPVDRVPLRIPLLELYVPLKARRELPEGETWKQDERRQLAGRELAAEVEGEPARRLGAAEPVLELLHGGDARGLVILGDPGAGKTTLLKMVALKLARGEGGKVGIESRLPVLVPLSGYATALGAGEVSLGDYLGRHLADEGFEIAVKDLLAGALERGEALVMLDGLDEVKDPALRGTVVDRVVRFFLSQARRGNRFVVTSRIVGYKETRPAPTEGLVECTLLDFDGDEIAEFVARWTAMLERQAHGDTPVAAAAAEREKRDLLAAIHRNSGVRKLAANPLLLTILALMKRQDVALPERRVQLYERYVDVLVSTWNRARGLGRAAVPDLDPVNTVRLLAALALWMHRVNPGAGLVRRGDLLRQLQTHFATRGEPDPEATSLRFLGDVARESSLLLERGPGEYGFIHLTFEEYLAAVGLYRETQGDVEALVTVLGGMAGIAAWREVALLTVGYLGIVQQLEEKAGQVVEALAERRPGPPGEAVVLAGEGVLDAGSAGVPAASRERVVAALRETMQSGATPPALRREAGLVLGRLGWAPDDLDAFVEVPAGEFLYGEAKERRRIERDFWIARYPVTNRQFRRFLEDRGYERPELWSEDGWRWRCEKERSEPSWWEDAERGNPIFPVVGVSRFEADAYCRWLGTRPDLLGDGTGLPDPLPPDYGVSLPSEEEWERAARGTDGREYPWGDEFEVTRANTEESDAERKYGIGTTAVCTYPQGAGPAGIWDAGGNVWEWTSSPWAQDDPSPVVRGGSWINDAGWARCASRLLAHPVVLLRQRGVSVWCFPWLGSES